MEKTKEVSSVSEYLNEVYNKTEKWSFNDRMGCVWFRGQEKDWPLVPRLFQDGNEEKINYDEFWMTTTFRNRAAFLKDFIEWGRLDRWLFLAQHHKLPTRLLDWSESPLVALYFAIEKIEKDNHNNMSPVVYLLHPIELNKQSKCFNSNNWQFDIPINNFPNSWVSKRNLYHSKALREIETNPAVIRTKLSFYMKEEIEKISMEGDLPEKEFFNNPIAVQANYIDSRLLGQDSCFTIHGADERSITDIFKNKDFEKNYIIPIKISNKFEDISRIKKELKNKYKISETSLFPSHQENDELTNLAEDLKERFQIKNGEKKYKGLLEKYNDLCEPDLRSDIVL